MIKFLKALFFPEQKVEVVVEGDARITINKKEGTMVIDTTRDLSPEEIKDYMKKYL